MKMLAPVQTINSNLANGDEDVWKAWKILPLAGAAILIYALVPRRKAQTNTKVPLKSDEQYNGTEFPMIRTVRIQLLLFL